MILKYEYYVEVLKQYPNDSNRMSEEFLNIFENALNNKDKHLNKRNFSVNKSKIKKSLYFFRKNKLIK